MSYIYTHVYMYRMYICGICACSFRYVNYIFAMVWIWLVSPKMSIGWYFGLHGDGVEWWWSASWGEQGIVTPCLSNPVHDVPWFFLSHSHPLSSILFLSLLTKLLSYFTHFFHFLIFPSTTLNSPFPLKNYFPFHHIYYKICFLFTLLVSHTEGIIQYLNTYLTYFI